MLAAQVRAGDLLIRIGRDEVAVLLPGADNVAARRVAARIRAAITDSNAPAAALHTAVVVGAAHCPAGGALSTALRAAKQTMTQQMSGGGHGGMSLPPAG